MRIAKVILYIVLRILYVFACLQPVRKCRVTFITLTSDSLKDDFALISQYLNQVDSTVELKYILTRFQKNIIGDLRYFFNCLHQIFLINSSRLVILNDNNYVVSNFKRKETQVIQIWHACGAVKRFGNEIDRQYEIRNYDFVLSGSENWREIYARAFGVTERQVIPLGVARTDILHDKAWMKEAAEKLYDKYPILKNKYIVFYVPTFRGNIIDGLCYEDLKLTDVLKELPEDTVILYRMHPLLKKASLGEETRIINVSDEDLNELYCVTDCLVTDYSSVVFDFSVMSKKMVLYVPDLEEYKEERGLNIPLEDIPAEICASQDGLVTALKNRSWSIEEVIEFRNTYAEYLDGHSTERIGKFILKLLQ